LGATCPHDSLRSPWAKVRRPLRGLTIGTGLFQLSKIIFILSPVEAFENILPALSLLNGSPANAKIAVELSRQQLLRKHLAVCN